MVSEKEYPLTFQQRFYLEGMKRGHLLGYPFPYAVRLVGLVDVGIVRRSIEQLMRRHSVLRTRIVSANGSPMQVIGMDCDGALDCVGDDYLPENDRASILRKIGKEIVSAETDLSQDRLFRAYLLSFAKGDHVLILTIHHIIFDTHSHNLLLRDLWQLLVDLSDGNISATLTIAPQYSAYAILQERDCEGWVKKHGPYWASRLSELPRIRWPIEDLIRHQEQSVLSLSFSFGEELSVALRNLARREKKPLVLVVLTVYVMAVARICSMNHFVLPMNSLGHYRPSDSLTVGYFAHFLYLDVRIVKNGDFRAQLNSTSADFIEALVHQDFGRVATSEMEVIGHGIFSWFEEGYWRTDSRQIESLRRKGIDICPVKLIGDGEFPAPREQLVSNMHACFMGSSEDISGTFFYQRSIFSTALIHQTIEETKVVLREAVCGPG